MVRTERTEDGAEYVILYIWGDDHERSVMRCRHAVIYPFWDHLGGFAFHNNFWANIEMDLGSKRLVEKDNLLPTRESLYNMTDPDFMCEALKDDLMVQLNVAGQVEPGSLDIVRLNALAEALGVKGMGGKADEGVEESARRIRIAYGFFATTHILEEAERFCREGGKKLMIVLLCPTATDELLRGEPRYDQSIVDYLDQKGFLYFDMNRVHKEDFGSFNLSIRDYTKRYSIGHYSPAGNHFFAYAIKDAVVDWLEPKPLTYRDDESRIVDFRGYLPG